MILGFLCLGKIYLKIDLNSQIPEDFRLLTKQPVPLSPTLNIKASTAFFHANQYLYLHIHELVRTQTQIHSQQISYSFLKVARILKNDIFSYKKWPHYTMAVITNDNILLSISIALSICHGPVFWQQLSVHPFLDGICRCSKTTMPLILNTLSVLWSLQACGSGHH